jgi:hypothetical protein
MSKLFQSEKNLGDPKALEHKITYFCLSVMSLNAVSFLDTAAMSRKELYLAAPSLKREDKPDVGEGQSEGGEEPADGEAEDLSPSDVAVYCDPVLDPVTGVAVSELSVGDAVCCKLREDSVFFGLMDKMSPGFDGIVSGGVTAVNINEIGSAVVSLKLSEGVSGVLKLAGTVRIKILSRKEQSGAARTKFRLRLDVLLAVCGMTVFLLVMWFLLRFWG